jgi:basic amino acid/polyamine antiporter, APA family
MSQPPQLQQRLGLFSATTIIMGSMIGSGIFIAPAIMAQLVQSPGVLLGLWIFGGLFTILGALSYAELAAMDPRAGGQYVFLREAFGPFWAFLYGWTLFLVIQTGLNAAVSIAFAKYLGIFIPLLAESNKLPVPLGSMLFEINTAQVVACCVIILLTWINIRGVQEGALVQNIFTVLKLAALAALIVVGLTHVASNTSHFEPLLTIVPGPEAVKMGLAAAFAVALSKALFAYDSWYTVTFVAEEVRQPEKTLPRALLLGTLIVTLVYVLTNVAYLAVMPITDMVNVPENRVAQPVAMALFGKVGETMVIVAILISTFGCVNGLILSGARVGYAMAREGLFFRSCGILHPWRGTPSMALIYQGIWSCVLALTGSYDKLLTYTTFASVLFGALTVAGVFWLRYKQPDRPRPYRCWGYPVTPALYLLIALPFLVYVIQGDPYSTLIGLLLVCTGIPVYLLWRRKGPNDMQLAPTKSNLE